VSNYFLIIQARTGSKRFPEKILKKIFGKPILEILIDRIKKEIDPTKIILATSLNRKDKIICDIAKKKKIKFFRGSENNVMSRFIEIGKIYNLDTIIRITSDCPLVDPKLIKKMLKIFSKSKIDYLSNTLPFKKKKFPDGSDIEIFRYKSLIKSKKFTKKSELEHVTNQLWKKKIFKKRIYLEKMNMSNYRYSLDYPSDFFVIKKIYYYLKKNNLNGTAKQIVNFISQNQTLIDIGKKNLEHYLENKKK
tara:strand:- start:248 stop:994 length:747 start_codon:yes stop_codon:yes gene_type:complete